MVGKTKIAWTEETWNPTRGCSRKSEGCLNCYAERQAHRFSGAGQPYEGLTTLRNGRPGWTGDVLFVPGMLDAPLRWRRPRMVFVNSMSDLFHESVTNEQIAAVFGIMAACPQHTFQVLTKRARRMREWFEWIRHHAGAGIPFGGGSFAKKMGIKSVRLGETGSDAPTWNCRSFAEPVLRERLDIRMDHSDECSPAMPWPLPNVWLGVSIENQAAADERIPELLRTPAAVRFVSAEPLLGEIDLVCGLRVAWQCIGCRRYFPSPWRKVCPNCGREGYWTGSHAFNQPGGQRGSGLDWVIVGGESGPGARPCNVEWIRSIVGQCREAWTACFVKQLGSQTILRAHPTDPRITNQWLDETNTIVSVTGKGSDPSVWPEDLRVREYPR
jgi:protein gp37